MAGFHPLVVVAGAGELGFRVSGEVLDRLLAPRLLPAWQVRRALRRLAAAAREAGGREVVTARLPELVRSAGERLSWRVRAEFDLRELAGLERFRSCPRCAELSEAGFRWCARCEYEFTGADDHAHEMNCARWRQQAQRLRYALVQIQVDEFPPIAASRGLVPRSAPGRARR